MMALIRDHQLNIMLFLCGCCGILILLLLLTRSISPRRKRDILLMEVIALFLLWFDRLAYIYAGDETMTAYYMVRISNFVVFFLTPAEVFGFYRYLGGILMEEAKLEELPKRMKIVGSITTLGMMLAVVSAMTDLYYYFDESNLYHRGSGFLIAYITPVVTPVILYTVIIQYRNLFSKQMFITLTLYLFVPIICGILQIFTYGISIVNMSMVAVSVSLYISTYIDINDTVERMHELEIEYMQSEQKRMQKIFDQTATAFVSAVEKKDDYLKGSSVRVAEYARMIAKMSGKSEECCEKAYYAALLHDVGLIGVPDSVINNTSPETADTELLRQKPLIGREILSCITEYPYLSIAAHYSHERYNGTGYPDGLKGTDIPEIARIVAVADAYVSMTTKKRYRGARPDFVAREAFVKGSGEQFDPTFAEIMVKIIDKNIKNDSGEGRPVMETSLSCGEYRDSISLGVSVESDTKIISFDCVPNKEGDNVFSAPSIILFDSFDDRVHRNEKTIKEYHYFEYGEFWFNEYMISTGIRRIEVTKMDKKENAAGNRYNVSAAKYEDHIRLVMGSPQCTKEMIIALPDGSRSAYIGITGEHCDITDIKVETTGFTVSEGDIPRIAKTINYTDHIESDLKNIQVNRTRSVSTEGIEIDHKFKLAFHTMSLPGANLIWHCPYIVLFCSDDGMVNGANYHEYALIKLNGENEEINSLGQNSFYVKKNEGFPGWDVWKENNRKGMECEVYFERRNNSVIVRTNNLGIEIECITTVDQSAKVYAALTGDQVALTDIRFL